jgi:hypothetical protein
MQAVRLATCRFSATGLFCGLVSREQGGLRAMARFFVHYRTRGPVNALQMRLQG